ncbi:MAG: UDP-4-amino-4,6-dideoxy-N-acetyl-beta-L-altrosamine transaminase [Bacteroidales bacterium]|nr:UDP-4-amino-4,6-dideoxy-N-acetyl-beta-L-altrosamine transaminase [Bacteroidales bacterium]
MKPIPYGRQFIFSDDIRAVVDVLRSDFLTQGPTINEFEKKFADYVGSKYAVAVSSGTAALHLSALVLGVKKNTKVITTPITFVASANCVKYCGGEVCFADIDPVTYTIDIDQVSRLLESSPKGTFSGIIPVDFAGYPVNMEEIRTLADKHNLWILEDACHAPGGCFLDGKGEKQFCGNGKYADLAIFSFHPVKHFATGEGGMITTSDEGLYNKLRLLRTHGITKDPSMLSHNPGGWYYEMQELGFNYRLSNIHSALGISQLKRADEGINRRKKIAETYNKAFKNTTIITPMLQNGFEHAYHLYVIQVENRKALYDYLKENQIFTQVHYIPVHYQPYYIQFGYKKGDFPVAEKYYEYCLSLPMYPALKDEEQDFVIEKVIEFYR